MLTNKEETLSQTDNSSCPVLLGICHKIVLTDKQNPDKKTGKQSINEWEHRSKYHLIKRSS